MRLDAGDFALIQSSGGNMEQINAYLQRLIEESPAETEGLISVYLQELLKDSEKPGFCLFLLNLLAICEYGLPEDDVLLTVILHKDKVIGGDVYFTGKDARVKGILK